MEQFDLFCIKKIHFGEMKCWFDFFPKDEADEALELHDCVNVARLCEVCEQDVGNLQNLLIKIESGIFN